MKSFLLLLFSIINYHCLAQGIITTVAGGGSGGDGGLATDAFLEGPNDVYVDDTGNIYIADFTVIRKVDAATGIIHTVVGGGSGGDNVPANQTYLAGCQAIAFDSHHHMYIATDQRIRKVDAMTGIITTIAGIGIQGCTGDGGPATLAKIGRPEDIAIDTADNLYIADGGSVIRKVNLNSGIISTIIGVYGQPGYWTNGPIHLNTKIGSVNGICVDKKGNVYFSDYNNHKIGKINSASNLTNICGTGVFGVAGDDGLAIQATIVASAKIRTDRWGNIFLADGTIRKIDVSTGIIKMVAGPYNGFCGDNGPATQACLSGVKSISVVSSGNFYIADNLNFRVRKVSYTNSINQINAKVNIELFPNPSTGQLKVSSANEIKNIAIFSISGQMVFETLIAGNSADMDLSQYPNGVYLVKVFGEEGYGIAKLVIKN